MVQWIVAWDAAQRHSQRDVQNKMSQNLEIYTMWGFPEMGDP